MRPRNYHNNRFIVLGLRILRILERIPGESKKTLCLMERNMKIRS